MSETPDKTSRSAMGAAFPTKLALTLLMVLSFLYVCGYATLSVTDRGSRDLRTKAEMKGLEIAIKSYKTEYLQLPSAAPTPTADNTIPVDTSSAEGIAFLNILLANSEQQNPRKIQFWDPPPSRPDATGFSSEKGMIDRMSKRGFKILMDYNGDGMIRNPAKEFHADEPDAISTDVILYSAGRDGDFSTWNDNICSWK